MLDIDDTAMLEDGVARCGGRLMADEPVDGRALTQVGPRLHAVVGAPAPGA